MSEASSTVKWWLLNHAPVDVLEAFEAQAEELAGLKCKLRMIVSHATMGTTDGEGQSTNDICVQITALRNELYQDAKAAALSTPSPFVAKEDRDA